MPPTLAPVIALARGAAHGHLGTQTGLAARALLGTSRGLREASVRLVVSALKPAGCRPADAGRGPPGLSTGRAAGA
jgi:hypothetical protein